MLAPLLTLVTQLFLELNRITLTSARYDKAVVKCEHNILFHLKEIQSRLLPT